MLNHMSSLLLQASLETLYMVFISGFISVLIGLPIGILLYGTKKNAIISNPWIHKPLAFIIDITRSVPFIILLIALIPLTRLLIGTSIGTNAALVPLTIGAIPFMARVVENAMGKVNPGLIEAGLSIGATPFQIFNRIILVEAMPAIVNGITLMLIGLVGFAAMAGAVGGGGLGSVAINYGYQRFDVKIMMLTVLILVVIVHIIQWLGDKAVDHITH